MVKDKKKWKKAKKEMKEELKSKTFWIYISVMLILSIIFIVLEIKTIKAFALFGLVITQIIYNLKYEKEKFLGWASASILIIYLIIYISTLAGEFNITIFSILILMYSTMGYLTIKSFLDLNKSKHILEITLNYILLSILVILLFGMFFNLTTISEKNKILNKENENINKAIEYIWFSAGNFYMSNFGESPHGWSKTISYIEMMLSMIIHVILIAKVIREIKH